MNKNADYAVEARGLVKLFGEHHAVDGVDLVIKRGTVYGFLGPNGAGKTTTIRMLATLLKPDGGRAKVFGHDIATETAAVRSRISLTGQYASLDEDLTGYENLVMLSKLMGYSRKQAKSRAIELLEAFQLIEAKNRQVKKYSGGMRRRIDIAGSIVVTPDLLFLDEPTTGLDPRSRNQVWDIVRTLVKSGTTVLLTTQYLEEADQLADRIGVIHRGKTIAEGTARELKASVSTGVLTVTVEDETKREKAITHIEDTFDMLVTPTSDAATFSVHVHDSLAITVLAELKNIAIDVTTFSLGQPSLEEVFLMLTGTAVEEDSAKRGLEDE